MDKMHKHSRPSVFILVLNYCSLDDTLACVEAVRRIEYPNFKLLVIDNASPDGSGKVLAASIPSGEFLPLPANQGYAEGNNIGIRRAIAAGAQYVFVINPDVRLPPGSLDAYVALMEASPQIGALNPVQLNSDGVTIDQRFRYTIWQKGGCPWPTGEDCTWQAPSLLGAAILIRRDALLAAGLFDPLYFAYGEERDFCRRLKFHGFELAVTSRLPVIHLRTHENAGSDDWRLFLRLKGVYLLDLKDINTSFARCLLRFARLFLRDVSARKSQYAHDFRLRHYGRAGAWVVRNIRNIVRHRKLDARGQAYLDGPTGAA